MCTCMCVYACMCVWSIHVLSFGQRVTVNAPSLTSSCPHGGPWRQNPGRRSSAAAVGMGPGPGASCEDKEWAPERLCTRSGPPVRRSQCRSVPRSRGRVGPDGPGPQPGKDRTVGFRAGRCSVSWGDSTPRRKLGCYTSQQSPGFPLGLETAEQGDRREC